MTHVLVVEDDLQFRQMLAQMLKLEGHTVVVAGDGEEALQLVTRHKPRLIITDILLPRKDGIDMIMELAQSGIDTPVIAISGGRRAISADFNLESALLMGVKSILKKPFNRVDLRQAVSVALAGR